MFYGFTWLDALAITLFFIAWLGHTYVVNTSRFKVYTITGEMVSVREQWMQNMIAREGAPFDALVQSALQQGVLFFGSTSVLLIGGLVAGLGSADRAIALLMDLPFSTTQTAFMWEVKLLLVIFIFVFAFFKFAWSYRLYNYILIVIGASPGNDADAQHREHYARKLALLHALAARHFTTGLNSYFFALAAFTWFINAWLFMIASVWVLLVLHRRAFRSEFLRLLKADQH